jgi:hypothetical protein
MASKTTPATPSPITRDDLEAKFRGLQNDIQGRVEERKTTLLSVVAGAGAVALVIFFLLGRRSGKKRSTLVEIRRL